MSILACPGSPEQIQRKKIRTLHVRNDPHSLYRAMAILTGMLPPESATTDLTTDETTREAVRAMREAVATEIERHYGAMTDQKQRGDQRNRMYQQTKQQHLDQKAYTRQIRQTQKRGGVLEIEAFARLVTPYVLVMDGDRSTVYGRGEKAFVLVRMGDEHYDIGVCERSFRQQLQKALGKSQEMPARLRRAAETMERLLQMLRRQRQSRRAAAPAAGATPPPAAASPATLPPVFVPAWPVMIPRRRFCGRDGFYGDQEFAEF